MAMFGAGSMMLAAVLAGAPAAAQSPPAEAKTLLVDEPFTGRTVEDDHFASLGACLTAAESGGANGFGSCAGEATGPVPAAGRQPGYLQLTDADTYETGGIVYNKALRSAKGIEVTFAQFQYGGTGADGISFFLVDGATDLAGTGAWGGSLGYAQFDTADATEPGVEGGYLGLGLDAWGNFSADTEGRGGGCPEDQRAPAHLRTAGSRAPDNVVLRGPGQGMEGYCLLATSATDEKVGTSPDGEDLYGTVFPEELNVGERADAKRLVKLKVVGEGDGAAVTVDVKFDEDGEWDRALEAAVPEALPETFKFGFASSTGGATDVHLIRHLRVECFE
nr:hypothetical protein [Glycomyces amatae]